MSEPLISVIIPAFMHERHVLECLRSVHKQTYRRLELIFIDDCSSDRTAVYAEALFRTGFADRFENVIVRRHKKQLGAHVSLNEGIELAHGSHLAVLNSDDLYIPERIEVMIKKMLESEAEFAFSGVQLLLEGGDNLSSAASHTDVQIPRELLHLQLRQALAIARERSVGYALLRSNVTISTGNLVFTKQLARKVGGFLPLRYCHDWDFALQCLLHQEPLYVPHPLYRYRIHQANTFLSSQHHAILETEVVQRRFFRSLVSGSVKNPSCPSPASDPGYFEVFLHQARCHHLWSRENGLPILGHRVYDATTASGETSLSGFDLLARYLSAHRLLQSPASTSACPA